MSKKQILATGLKESFKSYESFSAEDIQAVAKEQTQKLWDAGFEATPYFIDPANKNSVEEFRELLRSKQWDGVAIGFGVRGDADLTPLFEQLVNSVLEIVKPAPRIAFPSSPHQIFERVTAVFEA